MYRADHFLSTAVGVVLILTLSMKPGVAKELIEGEPALRLAAGCPGTFTDGQPDPPDINVTSCHTTIVDCRPDEPSVDCGKRALMAGDWERAVQSFDQASDSCEADYGKFLGRLFRLYANFNNRFFAKDAEGRLYNQTHVTSDLNPPFTPEGMIYQQQYSCLADRHFLAGDSLIDRSLERIWENTCRLGGIGGGALPIRWVQGRCEAPLLDTVMTGIWDRVDAVLLYLHLFGSPGETKRFKNIVRKSSHVPCEDLACQPFFIDDQEVPRLPADSEWLLNFLRRASSEIFDPERDPQAVFYWSDIDGDGKVSPSDRVLARWYDPIGGQPTLALEDTSVAALWTTARLHRLTTLAHDGCRSI